MRCRSSCLDLCHSEQNFVGIIADIGETSALAKLPRTIIVIGGCDQHCTDAMLRRKAAATSGSVL
jgi:uncharacterized metal-binding protein